ncbi:CD82 antigen [Triplophysa rosa]|uniref:CD82 antigen-like n=1 Tax=Triplophysa rosa TaxID=992332 RepID=A0A9W7T588_TRIRA|nr:CD82 antigen [Triplophysa rosa]KAI7791980.1 putative CD82 antigen-like [Triplophysa rosa]
MKADDKLQILKFFLMLVNSVFVILGISIFACSAWILFDTTNFIRVISAGEDIRLVAGGLFFIGLVVVGVSLLGCTGACLENRCFITFYLGFLIIVILGQIFVTFVLLIRRQRIEQYLTSGVDNIIKEYGGNETHTSWNLLDSVQTSAKCCGRLTSDEWRNNTVIWSLNGTDIYPCSCFNDTCPSINQTHSFGNGSNIHNRGCETFLRDWLHANIIVIFGMDAGLLLIQVLQFILGVHTYRCIGRKMREVHPNKLLNAVEESPSSQPVHLQPVEQTYNLQIDSGHENGGYVHVGYDHGGYVAENYDQYHNREAFYEQDNSQNDNTPHNLEYQQGNYDQQYVHHQGYNGDDY